MAEQPESIWANSVNLMGLYSSFPIKCHINGEVWVDNNELEVESLGLVVRRSKIVYAALQKEDVEIWTLGVLSAFKLLQKWSSAT